MICSCGRAEMECKQLCNNCYKLQWSKNNKEKRLKTLRKYNASSKARETHRKYRHSENGRKVKNSNWWRYSTSKKKSMPKWADKKEINKVYKNCPKGYHVDHIIPLNSPIVCGLHVSWNLQYLLPIDNIKKGNKL